MAIVIDEILGEFLGAALEDKFGAAGAEADNPVAAGGVFASAELNRRMAKAAKEAIWQLAEKTRIGRNRPGKGWHLPRKRDDFKLYFY